MINSKVKFTGLHAAIVILFLAGATAAQTPPCSNRSMDIGTGVMTPGPLLSPGMHIISVGKKEPPKGSVSSWKYFGPFHLVAGNKYLAVITNGKISGLVANDATLSGYPNPSGNMAGIYYMSKTSDGAWYAVCTRLVPPPVKPSRPSGG